MASILSLYDTFYKNSNNGNRAWSSIQVDRLTLEVGHQAAINELKKHQNVFHSWPLEYFIPNTNQHKPCLCGTEIFSPEDNHRPFSDATCIYM